MACDRACDKAKPCWRRCFFAPSTGRQARNQANAGRRGRGQPRRALRFDEGYAWVPGANPLRNTLSALYVWVERKGAATRQLRQILLILASSRSARPIRWHRPRRAMFLLTANRAAEVTACG